MLHEPLTCTQKQHKTKYIGRTIKYSAAVVKGIETLTEPTIPMPDALPDMAAAYEKKILDKRVNKVIEEEYRF
jgi:hypothetical protein